MTKQTTPDTRLTQAEIQELKRLVDAATPGPWKSRALGEHCPSCETLRRQIAKVRLWCEGAERTNAGGDELESGYAQAAAIVLSMLPPEGPR